MNNFTPKEKELYKRIDEVVHYLWDPICVAYAPAARDEYRMYIPEIFQKTVDGADKSELASYLDYIRVERMCLPANYKQDELVASALLEWRDYIQHL